jgi:hypothetical protein
MRRGWRWRRSRRSSTRWRCGARRRSARWGRRRRRKTPRASPATSSRPASSESSARRDRARREQLELEDRTRRAEQELGTVRARLDERYQVEHRPSCSITWSEASGLVVDALGSRPASPWRSAGGAWSAVEDLIVQPGDAGDDAETDARPSSEGWRSFARSSGGSATSTSPRWMSTRSSSDALRRSETQRTDLDSSVAEVSARPSPR